jgi:hypothetical protein
MRCLEKQVEAFHGPGDRRPLKKIDTDKTKRTAILKSNKVRNEMLLKFSFFCIFCVFNCAFCAVYSFHFARVLDPLSSVL